MAQSAWPFENIDTTETQFSQWARNIGEGVKGSSGGTELKPFADSTGMTVKVYAGQSMVRGHYYSSTATETLTVTTSNPTNPRIDAVVLELDPTANTILLKVVAGTPASSPVAPTLTQTDAGVWQQLLGLVAVAAGTGLITNANVTDSRSFLPIAGTVPAHTQNASTIVTTMTDKSADYAIIAADKNSFIRSTGSAISVTINNVLSAGESVQFIQAGSGQITFVAGSGVNLYSADSLVKTAKQYAGATVVCAASGVYYLIGNLGA
jgi:hypothetical protein